MWRKGKPGASGDCPSAIVGLVGPDGDYLGTGFFVSPRLIMTCEHVVMGVSDITARRLVGGDTLAVRLIDTDPGRDLAVLSLEEGPAEADPIQPLLGLVPQLLRQFDGSLTAIGVEANTGKPLRLDNLALRLVVGSLGQESEVVREAQITGGAPRGLSGAPVFVTASGMQRICVGMMILGGSDSGQSLLRGPDAMVPFWRQAGIEDEIDSRLAAEIPQLSERGSAPTRTTMRPGWSTLAPLCLLLTAAIAGITVTALRRIVPPAAAPPAWIANELFPGTRELLGFAEDLEQFSRIYMLPPRNLLGQRAQVNELNKQVRLYNCTSDYLSSGKNHFREGLASLPPGKLKDLVVRASQARLPAKYTPAVHRAVAIGPVLPGQPSAGEVLHQQFQELVTTWSAHATQLDGPIRETREYLAEMEKELLRSVGVPAPHCPP